MGGLFSAAVPEEIEDYEVPLTEGPEVKFSFWKGGYYTETKEEDRPHQPVHLVKPKLQIGDLVAVKRGRIEHFMVYIGSDYCVHFYAEEDRGKKGDVLCIMDYITQQQLGPDDFADQPGVVALEKIDSIVGNDLCRIDNRVRWAKVNGVRKRRNECKIVEEAEKAWMAAQDSPPMYNIVNYNCETFALELRYGTRIRSEQAKY